MTAILIFTGSAGPSIGVAAAATALHAANQGSKTLLFSLAPVTNLRALLGSAIGTLPTSVAPQLDALALDGPAELAAAWEQEDGPPRKCEVANGVVGPGTEWRFGKDRAQPAYPRNTCSG